MKTIKKTILGFALSVFSIAAVAQCPTSVSVTVLSNSTNGDLTVSQIYNAPTNSATTISNQYFLYGSQNPYQYSFGANGSATFNNLSTGTYTLCVSDSSFFAGYTCPSIQSCMIVNVTNTVIAPPTPTGCPSWSNTSVSSQNGANGNVTATAYYLGGVANNVSWQTNGSYVSGSNPVTYNYPTNGIYGINATYTLANCPSYTRWDSVNVTNSGTVTPTPCNASFTSYTDSNCLTHFYSSSTGANLTYNWFINGQYYNTNNVVLNLANGNYFTQLNAYSNGSFCSQDSSIITVNCNGGGTVTPTLCNASFTSYTDSNCLTHFYNTSTGANLTYSWFINGQFYTSTHVALNLANGNYYTQLNTYSNGSFCSQDSSIITVNCNGGGTVTPSGCQVNSSFVMFGDSVNAGNYFAYNTATGNGTLSYVWNFGDGTTSTQAYPFHQYSTPGSYIVCLTTTSQTGTISCSSSTCDSSSVQRTMAGFVMSQLNVLSAPTSVKENATVIKNISAFPNPMADVLNIEVELTANVNSITCTIIDALGKVISVNELRDSKTTINTSNLDKGFYFLTITTDNSKALKTVKLVK